MSQGGGKAHGHLALPMYLFFFLRRGPNDYRNSALLGPFFKHFPHSEKNAQGIIGKHWKFYRSERIRAVIYVFYPFPTNSFIFSSLFTLKQIHTKQ